MIKILTIVISAIFIDNYVLSQFKGICPFLGVSKKLDSALGMGIAVTFVMFFATAVTYPIYSCILVPMGLDYLDNITFILIIALLVQIVEMILKKSFPPLYNALGVYLPLITTNCAVLGVAIENESFTESAFAKGFGYSLVNSVAAGIGFLMALLIFSGVRGKIESNDIPETFKGVPITLIAASIVSLAFMGFSGIVE